MTLGARLTGAFRALMGYDTPKGGTIPDWPENIKGHPYRLEALALDHAKAVRYVATVYACVMQVATDIAGLPVVIEREKGSAWEPVKREKGNLVDVWHRGNKRQVGRQVVIDFHANLRTHGNTYMVAEKLGFRTPSELWVGPAHLVNIIPGDRRSAALYVFQRGGAEEAIRPENVVHWANYQPEDLPIGMSPLDPIQLQYETRHDLMRLFQKVVRNGGQGAGYFSVKQPTGNGIPITMTPEEKEAAAKSIKRMRATIDLPIILDLLEYVRTGQTMDEMQFIPSTNLADADICRVMGVPPWLVGIKEGGKLGDGGANAQADERIYWMNLRKEIELRDTILTERLVPMFREEGVRIRTDLSAIPALNAPLLNAAQQAVALTGRPILTVNEARKLNNLPPVEDPEADELYTAPAPTFGQPGDEPAEDDGKEKDNTKPASKESEPEKKARLIDTPERAERWRAHDKLMLKHQARFESAWRTLLRDRKGAILSKLETEGIRAKKATRTLDLDALMEPDEDEAAKIARIYEDLIRARGREAAREIALELEVNLQAITVREFIKARQTVGLHGALDTFLQSVRLSLADGVIANESLSELAARISTMFEAAEQGRVLTIARTETVSAYNFASVEAWRQSGDVEQLEWLSARDSAVRETHAEADGQVVSIGAEFEVGGARLAYPGDPSGPPEETIQCRCIADPVLSERVRVRKWNRFFGRNGWAKPTNRIKEHAR